MANEHQKNYNRARANDAAEVGLIPEVVNPARKEFCRLDLLAFLVGYFPETTGLSPFSPEQKDAILRMQLAILEGGKRILNLFPRGFAKTTISENAALWSLLYGHWKFAPIVGADDDSAKENVESVKLELMTNDRLAEDFPEVITPILNLENKSQRCRTQTQNGELTHMKWGMDKIVLPSIRDGEGWTRASGGVFVARGITGRIRGMAHKRPDGTKQRPDGIILDDIQTDTSAMSPAQCTKRLNLVRRGCLRLGGHKRQISAIMNGTVIQEDDAIDQLADHVKHPEWEGLRIPMLKTMATAHDTLWLEEYAEIRKTYNAEDPHDRKRAIEDSNTFYLKHQESMDAGALATWDECVSDDEHSAIQHAYNIMIDDGADVFASECQNQPIKVGADSDFLSAGDINRDRVGTWTDFPSEVTSVGFHIDVQKRLLYWTVVGITDDFRIYPLYGTYPDQKNLNFEYRSVKKSIQQVHRGLSEERSIEHAIQLLLADLTTRVWKRQDGVEIGYDIGLVDGGYQTGSVRAAIANTAQKNRVFCLFGRGVKAGDVPLMQRQKNKQEIRSSDAAIPWMIKPDTSLKGVRNAFNDTNALKTFLHRRLSTDAGRAGSLELPKGEHRRYCEHLASSEYSTETSGPHGAVIEWRMLPGQPDNHWLDTTCGAIVAASISGKVAFNRTIPQAKTTKRRKVRYL